LVEQRIENPRVGGSIPPLATSTQGFPPESVLRISVAQLLHSLQHLLSLPTLVQPLSSEGEAVSESSSPAPKSGAAPSNIAYARDGEVVLYKRGASARWQARFKLDDAKWRRISTKQRNLDYAIKAACEAYDRARFLHAEHLPITSKRFEAVARLAVETMEQQLGSGTGKVVYRTYIQAINRYLIPHFGRYNINSIGYEQLKQFDEWRTKQMKRKPVASTVTNHTSALNRVFDVAVERGWMSKHQVPSIKNSGAKGTRRETFSLSEYHALTKFMVKWSTTGHMGKTQQMRELLRDYVLLLANTGMRHGTEAMNLKWRDIAWITKNKERYLQLTVSGKTKKRSLIALHNAENYLRRIQQRSADIAELSFDDLLKQKRDIYVFRLRDGSRPHSLVGTFRQLMRDSGLDKDRDVKSRRTLYSFRHSYATAALIEERVDIYTLAKQMGTSVKMIELHYGHVTPAQKADVIAGPRYEKRKTTGKQKAAEETTAGETPPEAVVTMLKPRQRKAG
jgi:integrase